VVANLGQGLAQLGCMMALQREQRTLRAATVR
jgi:hypothetical protein